MTNLSEHICAGKCTKFKEEQCKHCLIAQVEKREFDLGVAPDAVYVKGNDVEKYHKRAIESKGEIP